MAGPPTASISLPSFAVTEERSSTMPADAMTCNLCTRPDGALNLKGKGTSSGD